MRFLGYRKMTAVIIPYSLTKLPVAERASACIDPGVLVGWNRLTGQLSADPFRFLCQYDSLAHPRGGKRRSTTTQAPSNDGNIYIDFAQFYRPFTLDFFIPSERRDS